jgi:hypothetical protein
VLLQLAKESSHIHEKKIAIAYWDSKPHWFQATGFQAKSILVFVNPTRGVLLKWTDCGLSKPGKEKGNFSTTDPKVRPDNWYAPEILKLKDNTSRTTSLRQGGTNESDFFSEGLVFGY